MRWTRILMCIISLLFLLSMPASSDNSRIKIDVYYNDNFVPINVTPKPLLKIGEPFILRFDVTVNQDCKVYAALSDLGTYNSIQSFTVIDGPSAFGEKNEKIYEEDETYTYEWKLKATDEWAGGSMPINLHYSVLLPGEHESAVNGEFTAAYVTISEEHYDGPTTPEESTGESSGEGSSPTTPAFTAMCTVFALVAVSVYRRKHNLK